MIYRSELLATESRGFKDFGPTRLYSGHVSSSDSSQGLADGIDMSLSRVRDGVDLMTIALSGNEPMISLGSLPSQSGRNMSKVKVKHKTDI